MTDRSRSSVHGSQVPHSNRSPSEPSAQTSKSDRPPYNGEVDIIALVRSLQRTAGVADCFRKGKADCDDVQCNWRSYCLGTHPEQGKPSKHPQK